MGLDLFGLEWDTGDGSTPITPGTGADRHIRRAVRELLAGTTAFDGVYRAAPADVKGRPSGRSAIAVVRADGFDEASEWDDADQTGCVRVCNFIVEITVREPRDEVREDMLDAFACVAANAVNGKPLAGLTIPGRTILRSGKYLDARPPEQTLRIRGEAAYFVDSPSAHDDDDSDE